MSKKICKLLNNLDREARAAAQIKGASRRIKAKIPKVRRKIAAKKRKHGC